MVSGPKNAIAIEQEDLYARADNKSTRAPGIMLLEGAGTDIELIKELRDGLLVACEIFRR
jgi:hypothetical protein